MSETITRQAKVTEHDGEMFFFLTEAEVEKLGWNEQTPLEVVHESGEIKIRRAREKTDSRED